MFLIVKKLVIGLLQTLVQRYSSFVHFAKKKSSQKVYNFIFTLPSAIICFAVSH